MGSILNFEESKYSAILLNELAQLKSSNEIALLLWEKQEAKRICDSYSVPGEKGLEIRAVQTERAFIFLCQGCQAREIENTDVSLLQHQEHFPPRTRRFPSRKLEANFNSLAVSYKKQEN